MQDASSYSNGYSETQSHQIGLHPSRVGTRPLASGNERNRSPSRDEAGEPFR